MGLCDGDPQVHAPRAIDKLSLVDISQPMAAMGTEGLDVRRERAGRPGTFGYEADRAIPQGRF